MYIRPVHAELDVPTLHEFIREYPLGLFTTSIPHPSHATLQTTHIPFVLDAPVAPPPTEGSPPVLGYLKGHMARANPQAKAMLDELSSASSSSSGSYLSSWFSSPTSRDPLELKDEVLILFQAPVHSYLTPNFYTSTKPSTHKVVPTWNFAAVQVYGTARIHHLNNDETSEFLQKQLAELTDQREAASGQEKIWKLSDAPASYVEGMKKGIIGLEVRITRIEGRFKLSQEKDDGDWSGVMQGFRAMGTSEGRKMAEMIEERGKNRQVQAAAATGDDQTQAKIA